MSEWRNKTNSQLFYAQKALEACEALPTSDASSLAFKLSSNAAVLATKEAWLCWLNELSELLAPKQKVPTLRSFASLCDWCSEDTPDVVVLKQNVLEKESWVSAYLELESCIAPNIENTTETPSKGIPSDAPYNALSLAQVEIRALSYKYGLKDLNLMLIALKQHINEVRSRQVEW